MELRHLKTFTTIVEQGGFTKAGVQLGYTQSTITSHIQTLESEIGCPLFDRLGKRIVLTEAGGRLLEYAKEILRLSEEAVALSSMTGEPSGTIRIGSTESLMVYRLPTVLYEYKKQFPRVHLILHQSENRELNGKLKSGEVDLSVVMNIERAEADLSVHYLVREKLVLVAPPGHSLATKSTIFAADLENETLLLTEPGSYRDLIEHWMKEAGIHNASIDFWSIEAIKQCVMCGLGLSYLPEIAVKEELDRGQLVALAWWHSDEFITTQLAYHKNKRLSPAMLEFIKLVEHRAEQWRGVSMPF